MAPLVMELEFRADARFSGVLFGLSTALRIGGVPLSGSRFMPFVVLTAVKLDGAAFTGVKPVLTAVNPELLTVRGASVIGVSCCDSPTSLIDAFNATDAR